MLFPKIHRKSMLPSTCSQPPCMNIEVKRVSTTGTWCTRTNAGAPSRANRPTWTVSSPCGQRIVSSHGTKPYSAVTAVNPSTGTSPRLDESSCVGAACDQTKTARLATMSAMVRTGHRRVGTLSCSGIIRPGEDRPERVGDPLDTLPGPVGVVRPAELLPDVDDAAGVDHEVGRVQDPA